jgi:hypothetical protein
MRYPCLVFKIPGRYPCHYGTYDYRAVEDDEGLKKALADGWHVSMVEAADPPPVVSVTEELKVKKSVLGIKTKLGSSNGLD